MESPAEPRQPGPSARLAARAQAKGRAAVRPTLWRVLLQAVLDDPARAVHLTDLPASGDADAQALAAVVSLLREHPELSHITLLEHFREKAEYPLLVSAKSATINWGEHEDVEADFQGALKSLLAKAGRSAVRELSGRRPSELSPEEKARLLASLKNRKPA